MIVKHIPNCHCAGCDVQRVIDKVAKDVAERRLFLTEPTDQGNQYVIPGCEHDRTRGPNQMDLFK